MLQGALRAVRLALLQNRVIFRPGAWLPRTPADRGLAYEMVRLRYGIGTVAPAWWVPQTDTTSHVCTVIFFHGSDGNITHELSTLNFLYSLGVHVLMVDYPGYGEGWGFPNEFDCYWTAQAAWRFVTLSKSIAPEQIVLFGHSVGSAVAVKLATEVDCRGLVFQSGFTSVPDLAAHLYPNLPTRLLCFTRMNSLRRIVRCRCPILVMHSPTDEHIPFEQAQKIYASAPPPKKLVRLRGSHWGRAWLDDSAVRAAWQELLEHRFEEWQHVA